MEENNFTKVIFRVSGEDPKEQFTETIPAESIGNSRYIIQSSPFHVYGVSYLDIIKADSELDGFPLFREIEKKSGNSTYRLIVFNEVTHPMFPQFWKPISELGCTYESANSKLISVNIPADTDIHQVYKLFENGEKFGLWDFEEADFGHPE